MIINGKNVGYDNITIDELLTTLKLNKEKVVIEVNDDIISKERFNSYILNKEDKVEIISFVGGG